MTYNPEEDKKGKLTHLNIFLMQEDIPSLVQALRNFALEIDTPDARKAILINAGIHPSFRSKLTLEVSPLIFANKLVACFREYRVSQKQSTYHPMVSLLEYLLQISELEDQDRNLFKRLTQRGMDNLKGLTACGAIGRIESPQGTSIGTGVLINRQLLLTCCHVLESILEEKQDQAWVRFGYKTDKYGVEFGEIFELDLKSIDRYTASTNHTLDYALVRIIGKPEFPIARLSNGTPDTAQSIRLIHHPRGEPVQISDMGQIVQVDREFITHTIETDFGSSGAPIFDLNWHVVALHRGAPTLSRPPAPGTTEGIPISCIWNAIKPYLSAA
jgi:hypothetical protein